MNPEFAQLAAALLAITGFLGVAYHVRELYKPPVRRFRRERPTGYHCAQAARLRRVDRIARFRDRCHRVLQAQRSRKGGAL